MGINYSCPAPQVSPSFDFLIRPEFSSFSNNDYYIEAYMNIENATQEERHFLVSLILPLYIETSTNQNINFFLDYYIHNESFLHRNVIIARDSKTNQVEGVSISLIIKEYLLKNDYSPENCYYALSGISFVSKKARSKGIYTGMTFHDLFLNSRNTEGKNFVYCDYVLSPIVYLKITENFVVYPNSIMKTPETVEKLTFKLMNRLGFISAGEDNPFIVLDNTNFEILDIEKWFKNYEKLPREVKYYIDQTKLRKNIGLVYLFSVGLLEGNSLRLPKQDISYTQDLVPHVLLKEFYFTKPKI